MYNIAQRVAEIIKPGYLSAERDEIFALKVFSNVHDLPVSNIFS
jgi:hypothetical protein